MRDKFRIFLIVLSVLLCIFGLVVLLTIASTLGKIIISFVLILLYAVIMCM